MVIPTLILTEEDCLEDVRRQLGRARDGGEEWACASCGKRFENFVPHIHAGIQRNFLGHEGVVALCSEGCAIIWEQKESVPA